MLRITMNSWLLLCVFSGFISCQQLHFIGHSFGVWEATRLPPVLSLYHIPSMAICNYPSDYSTIINKCAEMWKEAVEKAESMTAM